MQSPRALQESYRESWDSSDTLVDKAVCWWLRRYSINESSDGDPRPRYDLQRFPKPAPVPRSHVVANRQPMLAPHYSSQMTEASF